MQRLTFGAVTRVSIFALGLAWSQSAMAQTNSLESQKQALARVDQALTRAVTKAKKVTGKLGYGFYEEGCIFGVMLRPGSNATESFSLKAGQSYVFIGSGDNTARNVDIILRDSRGKIVSKDIEADAAPFVLFQPKATGRYTMSLQLKSGWRGSAFVAATVLRKGGYDIPVDRIRQAAYNFGMASARSFVNVRGGRFNQDPNTWGLYGAVIRQGSTISSDPKRYKATNRGIIAVGDSSVRDIDLGLLDGRRKVIVSNTNGGSAPSIVHKTSQGSYSVAIKNNGSSGPALVMAILLDLPPNYKLPTAGNTTTRPQVPSYDNTYTVDSAFAGTWNGDWNDDQNNQQGTFEMRIQRNGSLTGSIYNATLGVSTPMRGIINSNGALAFNYSYAGTNYVASGSMRLNRGDKNEAEGRVSFSTGGRTFGVADFYLSRN